jgi:3-hydroxyethyl bacteriochlorophyllide a dehydrogenase
METQAIVLERPGDLVLRSVELTDGCSDSVHVDVEWSGISSGTEKLLWSGRMPPFPGLAYPLVPGYETVGRVTRAPKGSGYSQGDRVFVPGATGYRDVRGLFGGAAKRLIVPAARLVKLDGRIGEQGILLALAATAHHAIAGEGATIPDLIIGHGIVGRLIARIALALGAPAPLVWEKNDARRSGAQGYMVVDPTDDPRRDYHAICDASGDASLLDTLIGRLSKRGEITLAGFYETPLSFTFPAAFMREARIRIAAEWARTDIEAVSDLIASGALSLDGLVTDHATPGEAPDAYRTAFTDPNCLKMVLDWRDAA